MTTANSSRNQGRDWWRHAVVYQVYPRSFADGNGDGIGDLPGLTARVGYLYDLGIDAVWLSPFYPSALVDGGYDVDDYRDVDPRLGTLDDFDDLAHALHTAGLKLIVDIVPNHTSDRHEWFKKALASPPGSAARDRYIFRDGTGLDGTQPPSDWQSLFGGPAWTRVDDGQWYLHLFSPHQPDLNWDNFDVRDDFVRTIRFWSDRGADGFRVDVAHGLAKDLSEPLTPTADLPADKDPHGSHPWWDRDEVHDIYAQWRNAFNDYDPPRMGVAEAWVHHSRRSRYAHPAGLGQAFNFDLLEAGWDAHDFRRIITDNLDQAGESASSTTWVLSNHDVVRHPSRYGLPEFDREALEAWLASNGTTPPLDRSLGLRRAKAATLMMLALPGSAYLYQGEELGLHEVADLHPDVLQDPAFGQSDGANKGRDGCRVPLPWTTSGPSFGFGTTTPHLPQPDWFGPLSVQAQEGDPASTLALYRNALHIRAQLQTSDELTWVDDNDTTLHFVRPGRWHCLTNFGDKPTPLPDGKLVLASTALDGELLPPATTAWLLTPT